jgi:hypothetical protein
MNVFTYCSAIMQNKNHLPDLKTLWECVGDPNQEVLLRQAIALILNDPQELSPEANFDKDPLTGLNEGVPVENIRPIKQNQ